MSTPGQDAEDLYDVGLQPERTALAWRRTGLALLVAALASARILPGTYGAWALAPALAGVAGAIAVLVLGHRRYRATHQALTNTLRPLPGGLLPALTALLVTGGAAVAVALLITH